MNNQSSYFVSDPVLSAVASGAKQSLSTLIAGQAVKHVYVGGANYRGKVFVENSGNFLGTTKSKLMGVKSDYHAMSEGDPSTVNYECLKYGLAGDLIPDALIARSQFPGDLSARSADAVARALLLDHEKRWADILFSGTSFTNNAACNAVVGGSGNQWSSYDLADPLQDLDAAMTLVTQNGYGARADTIIIGAAAFDAARRCARVRGAYFATAAGGATASQVVSEGSFLDLIRMHLGVPNVFVGRARIRTSNDGVALTHADIWTDSIWIGCMGTSNAMVSGGDAAVSPVAALGLIDTTDGEMAAYEYIQTPPKAPGIIVSAHHFTDEVVLDANLAYLLTDAV